MGTPSTQGSGHPALEERRGHRGLAMGRVPLPCLPAPCPPAPSPPRCGSAPRELAAGDRARTDWHSGVLREPCLPICAPPRSPLRLHTACAHSGPWKSGTQREPQRTMRSWCTGPCPLCPGRGSDPAAPCGSLGWRHGPELAAGGLEPAGGGGLAAGATRSPEDGVWCGREISRSARGGAHMLGTQEGPGQGRGCLWPGRAALLRAHGPRRQVWFQQARSGTPWALQCCPGCCGSP